MIGLNDPSLTHCHLKLARVNKYLDGSNVIASIGITTIHFNTKNTVLVAANVVGPSPLVRHSIVSTPRLIITNLHSTENHGTHTFFLGFTLATITTPIRRWTAPLSDCRRGHRRRWRTRNYHRRSRFMRSQINPRGRGQVVTSGWRSKRSFVLEELLSPERHELRQKDAA